MRIINKIFSVVLVLLFIVFAVPVSAASGIVVSAENFIEANPTTLTAGWMNSDWTYMVVLRANQYLKYEVTSPEDGVYDVTVLLGRGESGKGYMTVENETAGASVKELIDNTGGYQSVDEFALGQLTLKAGKNTIKVSLESGAIYLEQIKFAPPVDISGQLDFSKNEGAYRKHYLPTDIEAEDFDIGVAGSLSEDGKNSGKAYRKNDKVDIYETAKNSGEYYIDVSANEWVNYTVDCAISGVYDISLDFFAAGKANIFIDENVTPIVCDSKKETGKILAGSVYLTKGTHEFKISAAAGIVSIDKILVSSSVNPENVFDVNKDYTQKEEEETVEVKNPVYKIFYVSQNGSDENDGSKEKPFKTIARARDEVSKINNDMTGDIYVYIDPGYYKQDETLKFTDKDGGKNGYNVIYAGSDPFSETVIGGGIHVTGWEKTDNEIYKAHLDTKNEIRNMYVNDVPAQRARSKYTYRQIEFFKNEGSEYEYDGLTFARKNFPEKFYDPERLELVYEILWVNHRKPVKSVTYNETTVSFEMEQPYFHQVLKSNTGPVSNGGAALYFENDLVFLDEPGEFYYDIKNETIYYIPREGENLDEVYVSDTEFLMEIKGSGLDNKIENLHFERLSFKHSAWYEANEGANFGQAENMVIMDGTTQIGSKIMPAQIEVSYAKSVDFKDCVFIGLGSVALGMKNAVSHSNIIGNIFKDSAGSAINIGHYDHLNTLPDGHERVNNILIKNNVIRRTSYEYHHNCAITLYYTNSVRVLNNDIRDLPYTGISMGWGWGTHDVKDCANNEVAYNRIEDVMSPMKDGAHIYTLGPNRNSTIHDNYVHRAFDYEGGIYFDQGSSYMKAYNNVTSENKFWMFARANAGLKSLEIYNNYADKTTESIDYLNVKVHDNFFEPDYKEKGWSKEAQAIIDASGVEEPYKRLLNKADLPDFADANFRTVPTSSFVGRNSWITAGTFKEYYKPDNGIPTVYAAGSIGNTLVGEWEEWEVEILETGMYNLIIQGGNGAENAQPKARLYIDGMVFHEGIDVPNFVPGKWQAGEIPCGEVFLEKGTHTFRIEQVDANFLVGPFKFSKGEDLIDSDPEYDEGKLQSELLAEDPVIFNDMVGHWAENSVLSLYEQKLINGTGENTFSPEREITLYETMLIVMRILGEDENAVNEKLSEIGYGAKLSAINNPISREELCDILMKIYASLKGNYKVTVDYNAYNDFSKIKTEYQPSIWGARDLGLFKGDTNNNFNPQKTLTRAEAATVINRLSIMIK